MLFRSFEDIIDSEVGDTTLTRGRNVEREIGLRQVFFKFDGGNPSGTQKDRIAFAQAMDAMRRGFDAITAATCGNYGVAVTLAAGCAGLRCVVYVPRNYRTRRIGEMADEGEYGTKEYLGGKMMTDLRLNGNESRKAPGDKEVRYPLRGLRVLVVDDDLGICYSLKDLLEEEKCEVETEIGRAHV